MQDEINAARRLLNSNVEPLEIADKFIHEMFELMKDGINKRYPGISEVAVRSENTRKSINNEND
ncbi:MAG: hypothetical protein ACTSRS_15490 [Candidatus Helarchaeota archaeon]